MMNTQFIEKLLELLNSSNAGSIEVRKNLWSTTIRVSKGPTIGNSGPVTYQVAAPAPAPHAPSVASVPSVERAPKETTETTEAGGESALVEIRSPMVGTFYAQPEPGVEPYVRVGTRIAPGQTLCIIEAMKIMNPIDAEVAGVIKEVAVKDAQPVEFGHVLFKVDPNA